MWITIAVVWSALLAGFLLGAWWSGSRRISEMYKYDDVLSREFKALLDNNGREGAVGGERSWRDASTQLTLRPLFSSVTGAPKGQRDKAA